MDEREKTLLVSKAKELGWQVTADESGWVFLMSTQVGETFRVSIPGEDVVGELRKIYCGAATEDLCNAALPPARLAEYCALSEEASRLFAAAFERLGLTARAHDRVLRVARTIADLAQSPSIEAEHLAEAIQYRTLDRAAAD